MTAALASTLAFFVLSALGTLRLSDAGRVYVRNAELDDATVVELENIPRLGAGLGWPTLQLDLEYAPRFAWLDVLGPDPSGTLLLHNVALGASLRRPRYVLSLRQSASYGAQDFTLVLPTAVADAEALPGSPPSTAADAGLDAVEVSTRGRVFRIATAQTGAGLGYLWSRRWRSELGATLGLTGGADAEARQTIPRQREVRLVTSLVFARTRRDELGTDLGVQQVHVANGFDHLITSVTERWAMRWTEQRDSEVGVGVALRNSTAPDDSRETTWLPTGEARLRQAWLLRAAQASLEGSVAYAPDISPVLGTLQSRIQGATQATLSVDGTRFGLRLSVAQTVLADAPDAARVVAADASVDDELLAWLDLQLGGQIMWQRLGGGGGGVPGTMWLLYAGLVGRAPELRF